jgi:hypothetical protein
MALGRTNPNDFHADFPGYGFNFGIPGNHWRIQFFA